jgi:hypothetical protein
MAHPFPTTTSRQTIAMDEPFDHPAFDTDNGYCAVTPDALLFYRETVRFPILSRFTGQLVGRNRLMFGVSGVAMILFGMTHLGKRNPFVDIIIICAGGFNLYRAVRTPTAPTYTLATTIPHDAIHTVTLHQPEPPRSRGQIIVRYERDGETRQRTIEPKERSKDGFEEFEEAAKLLRDAGLPLS